MHEDVLVWRFAKDAKIRRLKTLKNIMECYLYISSVILCEIFEVFEENYLVCDHCKLKKLTPEATLADEHFLVKLECMCKTIMRLTGYSQTESAFTFLRYKTQFNGQWLNNFDTKFPYQC